MSRFKKPVVTLPEKVDFLDRLRIVWKGGMETEHDYFKLRFLCPCASCVDELTGVRTLRQENVRPDVRPVSGEFVGNYALRINWSDGHNTGIYTFASLYSNHPAQVKTPDKNPPNPSPE